MSAKPPPETARISTATLLRELGRADAEPTITLGDILKRFHTRAFGVLTLIVLLPAFLPVPVGVGAISGPLVALTGLQMLIGLPAPWLPRAMRQRSIQRATIVRFAKRMHGVLHRLERACRPRLIALTSHTAAHVFTGLQLVLLGLLLSLPIPFTNYPFGILLMLYAIAMIEHDGVLLLIAWVLGCATIVASVLLSSEVLAIVQKLIG
ncbi:MAG: exopolysaccharide biosynthesis protein [Lysobacteraceae bacterium]